MVRVYLKTAISLTMTVLKKIIWAKLPEKDDFKVLALTLENLSKFCKRCLVLSHLYAKLQ